MLFFGLGYLYYVLETISDNSPLYLAIALAESLNAIVGWCFLIFYIIKYYKLNQLNANRKDVKKDETTAVANNEIRESVMVQLTSEKEIEDPKKVRQSVTNLFNKDAVLKTSRDFMNLRESVSVSLRASEVRASEQRASETLGGQQMSRVSKGW